MSYMGHVTAVLFFLYAQSCLTLGDPIDCSPPGSSVHGIFQARILKWVEISFSWGSSQTRDQNWVSCIASGFFTNWASREIPYFSCVFCFSWPSWLHRIYFIKDWKKQFFFLIQFKKKYLKNKYREGKKQWLERMK